MKSNKSIMAKADIEVSDLITDGGYLLSEQSKKFIVDAIKQSVVLKLIKVEGIKSHTKLIDKVGLNGRVLRPGTSGVALSAADRAKPVTDQVSLTTKLMKGEIRLNDEVLEDQIENGTFKSTVMSMMSEQVGLDLYELAVNGDTTSADTFLAQFDGLLALATSHVVNAGTVPLAKSHLKAALKALPSQYNRFRAQQRFMTSEDAELDYRDYLADRGTVLGDRMIEGDSPVKYGGRPILPIPVFPDDLAITTDCTNVLLMDPKNAYFGFWRQVKIETDRDISTGEWIMVATVRAGLQYVEEDAVVKIINVKTQ
jgi:HK97 family phage major capsid protein